MGINERRRPKHLPRVVDFFLLVSVKITELARFDAHPGKRRLTHQWTNGRKWASFDLECVELVFIELE